MDEDTNAILKEVLDELAQIKRILVFRLIRDNYTQAEIAEVLGVSQPTISRYFPAKILRPPKKSPA